MEDFADFEPFLRKPLDEISLGNSFLLSTNDENTVELDINTTIKKLQFDLQECEKRINKVSTKNSDVLLDNFDRVLEVKTLMDKLLSPSLQRVNQSIARMEQQIIQPYNDSVKLNTALKNLHQTLDLLRNSRFVVSLVQQLQKFDTVDDHIDYIKFLKIYQYLHRIYQDPSSSSLLSVKLVRDYYPIFLSKYADMKSKLITLISHEGNNKVYIIALYNVLDQPESENVDSDEFYRQIDSLLINKNVQQNLNKLTKSLTTPRTFGMVIQEINKNATSFIDNLKMILSNCLVIKEGESTNLLDLCVKYFKAKDFDTMYWTRLTRRFKKNIDSTISRGGPIAKNLKVYRENLNKAVDDTFVNAEVNAMFSEAVKCIR